MWRYSIFIFSLFPFLSYAEGSKRVPNLACVSPNGYGVLYSAETETATINRQGETLVEGLRCLTLSEEAELICGNGPMISAASASARAGVERYRVLIEFDPNRQTEHGSTLVKNEKRLANLTCEAK